MADPFRIRDHVSDFDTIVTEIVSRSVATRLSVSLAADLRYGAGPSETVDLFLPAQRHAQMPVHIFIHGGYWRMFSKRDYSYVADTITGAGAIAVIVDYALMPSVRMAVLVDQVRRAGQWVFDTIGTFGGDTANVTVSGHSAGAHLASFLFNRPDTPSGIRAALLLGGLYDLAPLRHSFLQPEIALTEEEVRTFSPLGHRHDPATRVIVAVGADETPPFHQQADAYAALLGSQGLPVSLTALPGANHMSSVRDLGLAGTDAADLLVRTITGA